MSILLQPLLFDQRFSDKFQWIPDSLVDRVPESKLKGLGFNPPCQLLLFYMKILVIVIFDHEPMNFRLQTQNMYGSKVKTHVKIASTYNYNYCFFWTNSQYLKHSFTIEPLVLCSNCVFKTFSRMSINSKFSWKFTTLKKACRFIWI